MRSGCSRGWRAGRFSARWALGLAALLAGLSPQGAMGQEESDWVEGGPDVLASPLPPEAAPEPAIVPAAAAPGEPAASARPAEAEGSTPVGKARMQRERTDPRRLLPHYEFLEDNYLDYFFPNVGPAGDKPLIFEAQAAPHLFLINQWWKVYEPLEVGDWRLVNSAAVTFVLRLRMVQEHSAPVRPPSYIPRFDYQLFAVHRSAKDRVTLLELRLTPWGHHSNGQQYCTFATGVAQGEPSSSQCIDTFDPGHPPTGDVNYRSGDFSTSFFVVGAHAARIELDAERYTKWRTGIGFLFEGNPRHWGPGSPSSTTFRMYGPWRAKVEGELRRHLDLGASWFTGMISLTASAELMWPTAHGIPGDRLIAELAYQPDVFRGMGVFARSSSGQDELNVLYAAGRTSKIVVGVVWSGSPQLQYTFGEQ